jgi:hypothetical protein
MEKHKVKIRFNAFVIALLAVAVCISGFARTAEQPSPKLTLISNVDIFDGQIYKNTLGQ